MEYFFSKFVLETTDALGMKDVAAIRGARTMPDDAASPKTFDRVAEFIDGRQIDHVEFLHRRRGDFGARELRGAILYDTSSSEPEPCLHVLNALLGYQGSGPLLSKSMGRPGLLQRRASTCGAADPASKLHTTAVRVGMPRSSP